MSKENAEKFCALYEQHKAIAKKLAELEAQSEENLVNGLVKMAKEMGLECTKEELKGSVGKEGSRVQMEKISGGSGTVFEYPSCSCGMGCLD